MFAIFSTEPGTHLNRYSIFKIEENRLQHAPITDFQLEATDYHLEPKSIQIGSVTTSYWSTGWNLVYNETLIPVLDFSDPIMPEVTRVACKDDYTEWCDLRMKEQIENRRVLGFHKRSYEIPKEKGIPLFVAKALVKVGIDNEDECIISMIPLKDCDKISVTNCYHCFNTDSLNQWYQMKKICPLCKTEILSIVSI